MHAYDIVSSVALPVTRQWLDTIINAYQREYPRLSRRRVTLVFVGDVRMRHLNATYRGYDKVTDVLSFADGDDYAPAGETPDLGDIIICVPQARRQARRYGHGLKAELTRLIVHGLVHLSGYDHEGGTRRQAQDFFGRERRIMRHIPVRLAVEHVVDDHFEPIRKI